MKKKRTNNKIIAIVVVVTVLSLITFVGALVFLFLGRERYEEVPAVTQVSEEIYTVKEESSEETSEEETLSVNDESEDSETGALDRIGVPEELRGVWISYHEWEEMPVEKSAFESSVDSTMERVVELKMNTVYVHARADADAMYPSEVFPWSKYVTGVQGKDPGYDPFAYFVKSAHEHGIRIHAWINPYRVTHKDTTWEETCESNPARVYLSDNDVTNDRWVLYHNKNYYFNPAIPEIRKLIIDGAMEIAKKYEVDGIHMDDYFYPAIDNGDENSWFDKPEYDASGSSLSISDWRRENVNILLHDMYEAIKEYDSEIEFGVSPAGNQDNLRSDAQHFADIDTWMGEPGYVDYVMPQLYWGFEPHKKSGELAPWAYEANLNRWIATKKCDKVKLYVGLPMYIAGTNVKDNNKVSEWLAHDDVIARQVLYGRETGGVDGYVFYAYSSFQKDETKSEVANLLKVFEE